MIPLIKVWKKQLLIIGLLQFGIFLFYQGFSFASEINLLEELNSVKEGREVGVYKENDSDTASIGVLLSSKDSIVFRYEKSSSIKNNYVAAFVPIEGLYIDFSDYDELIIGLRTNKGKRIPVLLSMHYSDTLVRYMTFYIEYDKRKLEYYINLNEFKTPAEWFSNHHVSLADLPEPSFNNIKTISFESCHLLPAATEDEISIQKIGLRKNLDFELGVLVFFSFIVSSIIFVVKLKSLGKTAKIIHIPVQQVDYESTSSDLEKITRFISANFSNADLTLRDVQKSIGIKGQKISILIKEEFHLSFPQYLTKLRIEEAKRVLKRGDFSTVSEVGYLVGFNSPANFNRVFKGLEGVSPKQFTES